MVAIGMARRHGSGSSYLEGVRASAERRALLSRAAHGEVHAHAGERWDGAPAEQAWHEAIAQADALRALCYPRGFWEAFDDLKQCPAKLVSIETSILFLEEDAMFFRSGYVKAFTITRLTRQPLDAEQIDRLGHVVLGVVDRRASQEFRRYCRLAVRVATPSLREALEARRIGANCDIARRAGWVLQAIESARGRSLQATGRGSTLERK